MYSNSKFHYINCQNIDLNFSFFELVFDVLHQLSAGSRVVATTISSDLLLLGCRDKLMVG